LSKVLQRRNRVTAATFPQRVMTPTSGWGTLPLSPLSLDGKAEALHGIVRARQIGNESDAPTAKDVLAALDAEAAEEDDDMSAEALGEG